MSEPTLKEIKDICIRQHKLEDEIKNYDSCYGYNLCVDDEKECPFLFYLDCDSGCYDKQDWNISKFRKLIDEYWKNKC